MSIFEFSSFEKSDSSKFDKTPLEKRESNKPEELRSLDETIALHLESGVFENFEKNNKSRLNKKQKKDYDSIFSKKKIIEMVESFADEIYGSQDEKKEKHLELFLKALDLAINIHSDQKPRPDGPYINHVLRVSEKIIGEYGVKDIDLIIAALLHDSVEDQSEKLADLISSDDKYISKKDKALLFINNNFGPRVEGVVSKLTNPEYKNEGSSSYYEKNKAYIEHIDEAIEDFDVFIIKLADFTDNVLNLESIEDVKKRLKLSHKYLPVIDLFIKRLDNFPDFPSKEKNIEIKNDLEEAYNIASDFIDKQK